MAARLITGTKKHEHIRPILSDLHWLPIEQRIKFKILVYVYKCQHDSAPEYLRELLNLYVPKRNLRSMDKQLLMKPRSQLKIGDRRFAVGGPELWNKLSLDIRSMPSLNKFRKSIKTLLFKEAFQEI